MNVLMVGSNKAPGSWDIRGVQLGERIGARVTSAPVAADWKWADVAVLVKRHGAKYAPVARGAGVPVVWDALDFWGQPADNDWDEAKARAMLQVPLGVIEPALVIGATQAMADAFEHGAYLPHHSWRGLEPVRPQDAVTTIGYQGHHAYLGQWAVWLMAAAEKRGWKVLLNPEQLWQADILVSFRDGPWDGWMCREWKSGVKHVNAIAAGRPLLRQPSAASREIEAPGTVVETQDELDTALDAWTPLPARQDAFERCRAMAPAYRLPAIADRYRDILATVRTACPA